MGNSGIGGILLELPKLISGNQNYYPNLGFGTSDSINSDPVPSNSRVICPDLALRVRASVRCSALGGLPKDKAMSDIRRIMQAPRVAG